MATNTTSPTPEQLHTKLQGLLNGPAVNPPAGVIPNFVDPPNLDAVITSTIVLCITFATIAVVIRMYTKLLLVRSTACEDYVVVIAWLMQIGETIPSGLAARYGAGIHMWNIRLKIFFRLLYYVNLSATLYGPLLFLIKLSILLQYLRIFVPAGRKGNMFMFVGVHICIWSCFIFYLIDTFFDIFMCSPREKIWNPLLPGGHCFSTGASFQASGIFNIVSDFAILILPMPAIWRLQMPLKRKLLMIAIFATGLLACITSIVRTYYTWVLVNSPDISYNISIMGLWTWAEIAIGIIVSCLPVSPKFFQHFGPKIHSLSFGSKSASMGNTDKTTGYGYFKRRFAQKSGGTSSTEVWDGTYEARDERKREYVSLEEYDAMTGEMRLGGVIGAPDGGIATRRDDLEKSSGARQLTSKVFSMDRDIISRPGG